ncbi:probable 4-coumarate--CoA ligase 3 [Sitodiplosis mosellana]|uniref:probable 4-coumarate--CoA ligase 3 n=1 Tax=Sitodiplosis mosellana TaxID=263140 RepID=UPI0024441420|nr:probable 4-coumarate--CoA ligase 3 [Sitodiplosis mosellana]
MSATYFDADTKVWSGFYSPIVFNPKISLGHAILWTLDKNPHKILQINHETNIQLTSAFMRRQTIRAAFNLQKLGCEKGDIFGIIAKNSHYVATIVFASLCIGCPVNTLDPSFTKLELMHMLSITRPKVMFCDASIYDLVQECLNDLENDAKIFTFSGQSGDSIPVEDLFEEVEGEGTFCPVELDGENTIAAIICTSGSTGLPKGVCLSHAIILHQSVNSFAREDDTLLTFSTIYWISGLLLMICSAIKGFCRIISTERFTPELMLNMIEEHRVTYFMPDEKFANSRNAIFRKFLVGMSASHFLVLALKCEQFYRTDLSSIRVIMCGGSKLAINTALEMKKYLKNGSILQVYGMSEVAGCTSAGTIEKESDTSVGQLVFGTKAKIIDDDGNQLGINEPGELCTKTKFKFLGYFNNEEATNSVIDEDGFLRTGDIGYFDDEGNLFLVDRKKDMMKYCSSQISPTELEQYLIKSPIIKSVCVVGIPDQEVGDLPAAVIVQNDNETPITSDEVEQMITNHFADYKRLRGGVYFVESLSLTPSGKVLRRCVKEIAIKLYNEKHETDFLAHSKIEVTCSPFEHV